MIDPEDLRRHVATLSDEALLDVNRQDLVDDAQTIYDDEVDARGLTWPSEDTAESAEAAVEPDAELVSIAQYESVEEARFARTLLENSGIPVWFVGELTPEKMTADSKAGLELVTQAAFLEQALLVLSTEVSDEELARQAEEAGAALESEDVAVEDAEVDPDVKDARHQS